MSRRLMQVPLVASDPDPGNLDEFNDPPNYDIEEAVAARARIPHCCELTERYGGPVLDLCCGTGLITLPLASKCKDVTGVDLSRPMLDYARAKAARTGAAVAWHLADARSLDLGQKFELIFLTGNAFQAFLTVEDQRRVLQSVHRHLNAGGTFVFETRNPGGHELRDQSVEEFWYEYQNVDGYTVRVSGTQAYEPEHQLMHWTTYRRWESNSARRERVSRISCRFTSVGELNNLLASEGFEVAWQHGDWNAGSLTASSEQIVTCCRLIQQ